jgi:hypothetical protein
MSRSEPAAEIGEALKAAHERDVRHFPVAFDQVAADRTDPSFDMHIRPENVSLGAKQTGTLQRGRPPVEEVQQADGPGHSFLKANFLQSRGQVGPGFRRK